VPNYVAAVGCALIFSAAAHAQPPELADAEKKARQALVEYQSGQYEAAGRLFLEAWQLSGQPTPLRNAAKAFELAGALDDAIVHWSVFATLPEVSREDREEARRHVLDIREKLQKPVIAPPPEPAPRPDPAVQKGNDAAVVGTWTLIGSGAALVVTGGALFGVAESQLRDLDVALADRDALGKVTGIERATAQSDLASINDKRAAGIALLAVGSATLVGGVAWGIASLVSGDDPPPGAASVVPTRGGAVLMWSGGL